MNLIKILTRIVLFGSTLLVWWWVLRLPLSRAANLVVIVGGVLLVIPTVWLGREMLDRRPTVDRAAWITTSVHVALMSLFGAAIIRAVTTHDAWVGWVLPIPVGIGRLLVMVTTTAALLTVINLALKGLGAPFAIALSRRLTVDWLYAWTRNPMVLATLASLLAFGIWFQSALFVLWVVVLVTPAWLLFVKVYEERELEIRFGAPYLEYRAKTPMLFPKRPRR